ncbi:MAG TPA: hypothetical protein VH593_27855 [Ktedonobacteraceae bacterium]|jgi:hypothetical protein
MHDTLPALVEKALAGSRRPLEFYLRENSRLPGPRANLELAQDLGHTLSTALSQRSALVRALLDDFLDTTQRTINSNTPDEFIVLCGIVALGICASMYPAWRSETFDTLDQHANSGLWRMREGVTLAYQELLSADPGATIERLLVLAMQGSYLQQRAAIASFAEPRLLYVAKILDAALTAQRLVLERVHVVPASERKQENFRILRRTLGYTLSVVTASAPDAGFSIMRECVGWGDGDIRWILRENLRKKRLAKFAQDTESLLRLLA